MIVAFKCQSAAAGAGRDGSLAPAHANPARLAPASTKETDVRFMEPPLALAIRLDRPGFASGLGRRQDSATGAGTGRGGPEGPGDAALLGKRPCQEHGRLLGSPRAPAESRWGCAPQRERQGSTRAEAQPAATPRCARSSGRTE